MGKRIFWLAIVLAAALCGFYYYRHHQEEVGLANGEVTCIGCMSPQERLRAQQESSASNSDAPADPADRKAATAAANSNSQTVTPPAVSPAQPPKAITTAQPAVASESDPSSPALPAADTVAPNPPNGMVFTGKGTYQWYRQGNLTWRVDTASGRSCIVYATMAEWRKQIVYSHGCGHTA